MPIVLSAARARSQVALALSAFVSQPEHTHALALVASALAEMGSATAAAAAVAPSGASDGASDSTSPQGLSVGEPDLHASSRETGAADPRSRAESDGRDAVPGPNDLWHILGERLASEIARDAAQDYVRLWVTVRTLLGPLCVTGAEAEALIFLSPAFRPQVRNSLERDPFAFESIATVASAIVHLVHARSLLLSRERRAAEREAEQRRVRSEQRSAQQASAQQDESDEYDDDDDDDDDDDEAAIAAEESTTVHSIVEWLATQVINAARLV